MIKIGIAGAAGYTGGELLRILLRHPDADIVFAHSRSRAGQPLSQIHGDLLGETALTFSDRLDADIDVLFLCLGHGESVAFLEQYGLPKHVKLIDLSQDFRLKARNVQGDRTFVYGLPEQNRKRIAAADSIANPGCFATALQLGLLPLIHQGFDGDVYATGITGATGAGQKLSESSHFAWRSNNIQAYKSLQHQHLAEIGEQQMEAGQAAHIHFVPWRGDFARGIFVSQQLQTTLSLDALNELYETWYATHPFTVLSRGPIHMKQAVNTNKCLIHIEQVEEQTVIHTAIDNLLKGASGQAVQNMNLMFGLPEDSGLRLKASYF
ncbi:N-acetyl-gamma-glutamyl-phosphate reductase [Taibaiella koreensis]|uniref:N-acetyl-gamma-glutamyl-phosphate reductase n=1 Tax=Taibaiella koreensis TaxID=1268548 RepID=UPI000E59DA78|nr:N-acetyl-gamma-glutamyl-phosphate reductase [Taibaiella koreensis]